MFELTESQRALQEAARKLAGRMINDAGSDPTQRLVHGFELCVTRKPGVRELGLLRKALDERLSQFKKDPESAARIISVGQAPIDSKLDSAELAAYTTIARMMLNLSEFITKG